MAEDSLQSVTLHGLDATSVRRQLRVLENLLKSDDEAMTDAVARLSAHEHRELHETLIIIHAIDNQMSGPHTHHPSPPFGDQTTPTFEVGGSSGTLVCDRKTGTVLEHIPLDEDPSYDIIDRVDVQEYIEYYGGLHDHIDILLIGHYWRDEQGRTGYEPANTQARADAVVEHNLATMVLDHTPTTPSTTGGWGFKYIPTEYFSTDLKRVAFARKMVNEAAGLFGDGAGRELGENVEYERGIAELICRVLGIPSGDYKADVLREIYDVAKKLTPAPAA